MMRVWCAKPLGLSGTMWRRIDRTTALRWHGASSRVRSQPSAGVATFVRAANPRPRGVSARGYSVHTEAPGGSPEQSAAFKLIIYSKDECCLCQGLKEKLSALWEIGSLFQNSLTGAKLEVRDITTNSAWLQKYQHEIPVLARAEMDDSGEVVIPRPSPRFSVQQLDTHLGKALAKLADG